MTNNITLVKTNRNCDDAAAADDDAAVDDSVAADDDAADDDDDVYSMPMRTLRK